MSYSFSTRKSKPKSVSDRPLWHTALIYFALVLAIWGVWESVRVYVTAGITIVAYASADSSMISQWWDSAPVFGFLKDWVSGIATFISTMFSVVAMVVLYGFLQLLELSDVLLRNSPQSLDRFIVGLGLKSQSNYQINENDAPIVQALKQAYNSYGESFFESLFWFKICAYFFDLIFCCVVQPPLIGGWGRFSIFTIAPMMSDIDFRAIASNIVTLFAVEIFVVIWLWLRQGRFLYSLSSPNPN